MAQRMTTARRERLIKRKQRHETILDGLYDLLDEMTKSDVQSYAIGSRNLSKYKNVAEVRSAIEEEERRIDEIDAALNGHRRKAVAVVIRDA